MRRLCLVLALLGLTGLASATVASEAPYYLALGKIQADEGSLGEALESFARAVALAPEDIYIRLEFAALLLRSGRIEQATEQVNAAWGLAPHDLDVLRLYSQVHLRLGERQEESLARAKEALEQLRHRDPGDVKSAVSLGQIYLGESEYGQAAEVFRQALGVRPDHRGVHSLLVEALLRSGQAAEAESALRDVLAIDPEFTRARLKLADLQSERGKHLEAAESLERAFTSNPTDPEILSRLGLELYRAGELERALAAVEGALEQEPTDFGALYLKALISTALGRHQDAADLLRGLRDRRPESLDLALLLARVLEHQEQISEAAEVLDTVAERLRQDGDPARADRASFEMAALLSRAENWSGVAERLEPLLLRADGGEERIELLLLYAEALARLDRGGEALALLEQERVAAPLAFRVTAKRAEILFALERPAEAQATLQDLEALDELDSLSLAAEVYQRYERYSEAIPVLERALELRPESVQLRFWLGAAFERTGQQEAATRHFEELLEIEPEFAPALNYLGYMWAEGGQNLERALELVRQAVALDPDNGAYADSLGWAHFQLGNYDKARDHLERAVKLVGEDAVVFEHLGDLYVILGRLEEAGNYYRRALALEAGNAEQVLRKLERLREDLRIE